MNVAVLVKSLNYLDKFNLISCLSIWINQELISIFFDDSKFLRSIKKWDYEVTETLIPLANRHTFEHLIYRSHSGHNFRLVKLLIDFKIMIPKDSYLLSSCNDNNLEMARLLLDYGANVHTNNDQALRNACSSGYIEIVRLLLAKGANVHAKDDESLISATYYGCDTEMIKLLLDHGADVHVNNDLSLRYASLCGKTEVIKLLLNAGANVHANSNQALIYAKNQHYSEIVKILEAHMRN